MGSWLSQIDTSSGVAAASSIGEAQYRGHLSRSQPLVGSILGLPSAQILDPIGGLFPYDLTPVVSGCQMVYSHPNALGVSREGSDGAAGSSFPLVGSGLAVDPSLAPFAWGTGDPMMNPSPRTDSSAEDLVTVAAVATEIQPLRIMEFRKDSQVCLAPDS